MIVRLNKNALVYSSLFLLSASVLCFEIVSTRIASVIFAQDYAFIILSLALLGLGAGGVYSYYMIKPGEDPYRIVRRVLIMLAASLCLFVVATIKLSIATPFIFLFLLILPFFFSGIAYSLIYKAYGSSSFTLYASDLAGAAFGSVASLGLIGIFGAPNSVIVVALVMFTVSAVLMSSKKRVLVYAFLALSFAALVFNGRHEFLGRVPIGNFPEKDFYYVYPDAPTSARIIDSRWSIYGRADLVQYSRQDMVRQLFVDGAAGSQVYRFNGNVRNTGSVLQGLMLQHTNAIPFLCLTRDEKRSMLVIGPGGGKEVLLGLFGEADTITAVEVNPDFVAIVKEHRDFDGGLYTDFPNVKIIVEEGRHFVKQSHDRYDLLVMALPSTAQMQNIEPFATSENFLLTKEAIADYLEKLNPEGRLILTVHNEWELTRLIATVVSVFQEMGVPGGEIKNHFSALEAEYAPTVVIKKTAFTPDEARRWSETSKSLPRRLPTFSYLPYGLTDSVPSTVHRFLGGASRSPDQLRRYVAQSKYDISPCTDDRPYFYKIFTGVPGEYLWLLAGTVAFSALAVWLPFRLIKRKSPDGGLAQISLPLAILVCTGMGFMILEVSLFQNLVLYLGSPTISLSILLSSLLIGMGTGSYFGRNVFGTDVTKRLYVVSIAVVVAGILLFVVSPLLLSNALEFELPLRAATTFLLILPLAIVLGIPFPSCIQLLTLNRKDRFIPWMYGINGAMAVLGSVLAVIGSMLFGFTWTYFGGLLPYLCVFVISFSSWRKVKPGTVDATV